MTKHIEGPIGRSPIAILGMACRLPGDSNSPQALWDLLEQGRSATTGVPENRFSLSGHFDGSRKPNTLKSPGAMFLENIDLAEFDAQFFSISKQEAIAMDPQQRQLLEVVYECLENAGQPLQAVSGAPVGCFVASSTNDYRDVHARDPEDRPANATVGLVPAILSNRISHFFNLKGPSMTIDTACSASLVSLDVACTYMQAGNMDAAIVAGVHLWLSPEANMDSGAMREAFSTSGKCHAFDAKADGYIKAEGVNAVLIKRLDDAIRDGDPIRAVIRGSATNSDGRTPGIANPSAKAQAAAIEAAYANAGLSHDIAATSYLECHGTGTLAGDPVEVQAASSVLCKTRGDKPLFIGSLKSNIGHSECSAGVSSLIKTVLALEKGTIPGNPTFITPNPHIDFPGLKLQASRTSRPWPKVDIRRASVNSFGFGGSNAHAILEEAKSWAQTTHVSSYKASDDVDDFFVDEEPKSEAQHVLLFSANEEKSLKDYVETMKRHLIYPAVKVDLQDLAYTLSERRTHHFNRGFVVTTTTNLATHDLILGKKSAEKPRVGFIFTGQGAQWSEMGALLVRRFPLADELLRSMDRILKDSAVPPTWSLHDELVRPRSMGHLRQPVLSQPLVTALQIVLVEVLKSWGIIPMVVVGHSSGEIAAAYCAGLLSMSDAIKAAYYRGQASVQVKQGEKTDEGMLAVGLGAKEVTKYQAQFRTLAIACINSPNSTTLSGHVNTLAAVEARLKADGHFARMLHVDHAYHSRYMSKVADAYKALLDQDFEAKPFDDTNIEMFSSVSGTKLEKVPDAAYWQKNMVSPVQFDRATRTMLSTANAPNFLIEIGPSGTLGGPISEIKASLPKLASQSQYCAAFKRGQLDLKALFDVAGRLFISGAEVDFKAVNNQEGIRPRVIIDLPNYSWNHSNRYWHESESSKDWRFRLFPPHDLIGSKVLGTSWHAPVWKKELKVNDISWLKDHKLGSDIVIPGAAMVVMAVEAMAQLAEALHHIEGKKLPEPAAYRVRNATFSRALVLEEGRGQPIMITLTPRTGSRDSWYEFKVSSLVNTSWLEHSRALIRMEADRRIMASKDALKPFVNSTPGHLWYSAMEDVGYALGPAFQKHIEAESLSGTRRSRSTVSLIEPPSTYPQSKYAMHPTSVDAILQVCAPALWNGNRTNINAVIIPAIIDDVVICPQQESTKTGMAVVTSEFNGIGDPQATKNYTADVDVFDVDTGLLLFRLSKLRTSILNTQSVSHADPVYCSLHWKPDISFMSQEALATFLTQHSADSSNCAAIKEAIKLVAFKQPALRVLEAVTLPENTTSIWMETVLEMSDTLAATEPAQYTHADAKALLAAQETYELASVITYTMCDVTKVPLDKSFAEGKVDLAIVRSRSLPTTEMRDTLRNSYTILADGGYLLFVAYNGESVPDQLSSEILASEGFTDMRLIPATDDHAVEHAFLARKTARQAPPASWSVITVLLFEELSDAGTAIASGLEEHGWTVKYEQYPFESDEYESILLVLDDHALPLLSRISQDQWATLQTLFGSTNRILWVTEGSQLGVTKPENAQIHGLMRTIHDEDPSINLTTLDVDDVGNKLAVDAIHTILGYLQAATFQKTGDYEYAERAGVLHVSRVLQDDSMNEFATAEETGAELVTRPLHETESQIRLSCERVGNLDSLKFHEVSREPVLLNNGEVEIEIEAVGLNFKDLMISTGGIAGNEHLLGFEGAGTVRRTRSDQYSIGQRVVYAKPGSFANRIITEIDYVRHIPDSMSFKQAATLGAVYPVSLYSLYDLANTTKGSRVLIHSAAGGIGIACIQVCQHIGAEIYTTVGNDEKRKFLVDEFGLDPAKMFNSRSTLFAEELMHATHGEGVDVIINALTGDLLEESWMCIRGGGTMVELGKRDIVERNFLPMEPFSRGVSYRSFDISLKSVPKATMSRLLEQTMTLLAGGHIKPISPIMVFPFDQITSAFRYMRDGKHMGKIVISNGSQTSIEVPVRPILRNVRLREDVAYLIVGGLKGLCGSVALSFARHGARHLIVMGRSGFDDIASRTVIQNIQAEGCVIHAFKGDVTLPGDVKAAFNVAAVPVGGVLQGAMVVRGKLYQAMTAEDYHVAVACKIQGTWNLHNAALDAGLTLDFFSLLSSTSGVAGQSGQANYVAANAFLDAFAIYRRQLGLRANAIALGPMWDVGYMSRNRSSLPSTNVSTFTTITESLFHKIINYSILQQTDVINETSAHHLITGMAVPLKESSTLRIDARFAALFGSAASGHASGAKGASKEMQVFNLLYASQGDAGEILQALIEVVGKELKSILQLNENLEPAKAPGDYGMESLAAVELRNWARMELNADVTMLEILGATSLIGLCQKMLTKMKKVT